MHYKEFGNTGIKLSRLGIGCMRYPLLKTRDLLHQNQLNVDIKSTLEIMDMAIQEGVNYFDTAHMYHEGMSEGILGYILKDLKARDKVYIATKMPYYVYRSPLSMEQIFEEQCERLRTDVIDFYLLHNINGFTFPRYEKAKAFEFLTKLKKEGRVRHVGFSFHDSIDLFEKVLDYYDWDFCQVQYNFVDEKYQAGMRGVKKAYKKGLGVSIMEPLKGGALAKTQPEEVENLWKDADHIQKPADRALRWLFDQEEVSLVLSSMNNKDELKENLVSANHLEKSMTKEELDRFAAAKKIYKSRLTFSCTGCRYCMPCPRYIKIPDILELYNKYKLFIDDKNVTENAKEMYNSVLKANHNTADECVDCGKCLKKCPQKIKIPTAIREAHKNLSY